MASVSTALLSLFTVTLILGAFVTVLLQDFRHGDDRRGSLTTILVLGLSLASLWLGDSSKLLACAAVPIAIALYCLVFLKDKDRAVWSAMGLYVLSGLLLLFSAIATSMTTIMTVFACMVLIPLFPVNQAFVVSVTRLPHTLSPFLAMALPIVGLIALFPILSVLSQSVQMALSIVAIVSGLYGSIKALVQEEMPEVLSYAFVAQLSVPWYAMAGSSDHLDGIQRYMIAYALIATGLLLSAAVIHRRCGTTYVRQVSGLAQAMPRLGVLTVLLITAAIGLPSFPLFSEFVYMLSGTTPVFAWTTVGILTIWLFASWYFPRLMDLILFGPLRAPCTVNDLNRVEVAAFVLILCTLVSVSFWSTALFDNGASVVMTFARNLTM